jgi:signal peptidase I
MLRLNTIRPAVRTKGLRLVLLLALLAAACDTSRVKIEGEAMSPTLENGSNARITRMVGTLRRGDIITFDYPLDRSKHFLKRIVGLPGEEIEITNGRVVIDGKPIDEGYVVDANRGSYTAPAIEIPAGEYYVMGDNRRNSSDSRHWGTVPETLIWGKVMLR